MVNTREIAEEYRLTHWAQVMQERAASGLSIKAYCKQIGICGNTYYYWQRRLRVAACEQVAILQTKPEETAVTCFAEVKVEPSAVLTSANQASQISVETGGYKITTDSGYPVESLAALLRKLKRTC